MSFIVQLDSYRWRSRCCFGVTSYPERAAKFETKAGAKINLVPLRICTDKKYPYTKTIEVTKNDV